MDGQFVPVVTKIAVEYLFTHRDGLGQRFVCGQLGHQVGPPPFRHSNLFIHIEREILTSTSVGKCLVLTKRLNTSRSSTRRKGRKRDIELERK